nr:hypothetical protein [Tanacetum cinerariifolium]
MGLGCKVTWGVGERVWHCFGAGKCTGESHGEGEYFGGRFSFWFVRLEQQIVDDNVGIQVRQNAVQNPSIQIIKSMNGLSVVLEIVNQYGNGNVVTTPDEGNGNGIYGNMIRCYNYRGDGHYASNYTVKSRKQDVAYLQQQLQIAQEEVTGIQSTQEEFEFITAVYAHEETERVKTDQLRVQNFEIQFLKEAAKFVQGFKSLAQEANESPAKQKALELEIERLLRAVASQDIMSIVQNNSVVFPKVNKTNAWSKPFTSNSAPSFRKSIVVYNERVIAPGIFRINHFKASRVDNFVPNKHIKVSVRTKPINVSQSYVITKNNVNSKTNGFYPKDVKNTTKTRRPFPRNNPQNDKVPSKSKSSQLLNNLEKIEENHRNLQSSSNKKHMSSECNNIKLAIRNAKSKDMNSHALNKNANVENVENVENQKKHKPKVKKPKRVRSKERLALPKPSKPRSCLRWSPTGRLLNLKGRIITSSESESQSNFSNGDNACTSNP